MGVSAFHRAYWDGRAYRRTKIFQRDHTFQFGDAVRWNGTQWVLASAATPQDAEAIGIVSHSGYGADFTPDPLISAEFERRAFPTRAFSPETETSTECNDPRHYFNIVFRGELTIPYPDEIDYDQNALMTGTDSVASTVYTPGTVYYLSPFAGQEGKLIAKSPLEFASAVAAGATIKPMLVALDDRRALVLNYVADTVEGNSREFVDIQKIQAVGSLGAFLLGTIPDTWLPCDGRLCRKDQYPELHDAIGGTVRVPAKIYKDPSPPIATDYSLIDYCLLDFTDEDIDVADAVLGEYLVLRYPDSLAEYIVRVDSVVSRKILRVIVSFADHPEVNTDTPVAVKVRCPDNEPLDTMFFVPNLRSRTIAGADHVARFTNPDGSAGKQFFLGDFDGSQTVQLASGTDITAAAGAGSYSATLDTRSDAVLVTFCIKAKAVDCGSFINECCADINPVGLNDNQIINGAFLVWQRGIDFSRNITGDCSATPHYTADKWFEDFAFKRPATLPPAGSYHALKKGVRKQKVNPGAFVFAPEGVELGEQAVELPDQFTSYCEFQGTLMTVNGATTTVSTDLLDGYDMQSYHYLENRVEDVRTLSGDKAVLSFWIRGSASGSIYTCLRQHFGGTRGILDDVYSPPVEIVLNGDVNWKKYEIELDIPDIQETMPVDQYIGNNSFLGVQFWTAYFAGPCTGTVTEYTPNPYDPVVTPAPEDNIFFGGTAGGAGGQGGGGGGGGGNPCPECWILRIAAIASCKNGVDCISCGASGTCASNMSCCSCTTTTYDAKQIACDGDGSDGFDPNERPSSVITDSGTCGAPPQVWTYATQQFCSFAEVQAFVALASTCQVEWTGLKGKCKSCCGECSCGGVAIGVLPDLDWCAANPGRCNGSASCPNMMVVGDCLATTNAGCDCTTGIYTGTGDEQAAAAANAACQCCDCCVPSDTVSCPREFGGLGGGTPAPSPSPFTIGPSPSSTGTPPVTPTSTGSPAVSPTRTPVATRTPTPTVTPTSVTPTQTPTNSPTPTPSPSVGVEGECISNCCLPTLFVNDFNYTGVVQLTGVQLIRGTKSKDFEETDYLEELKKCQRYFEKDQGILVGGVSKRASAPSTSGITFTETVNYMVPKRRVKAPCLKIQEGYDPDLVTGCTYDTVTAFCYTDESAGIQMSTTAYNAAHGLCAAYVEYEIDTDLYESRCPDDTAGCGSAVICNW